MAVAHGDAAARGVAGALRLHDLGLNAARPQALQRWTEQFAAPSASSGRKEWTGGSDFRETSSTTLTGIRG